MKLRNTLMAVILAVCTSSAAYAVPVNFGTPGAPIALYDITQPIVFTAPQEGDFFVTPGEGTSDGGSIGAKLSDGLKATFTFFFDPAAAPSVVGMSSGSTITSSTGPTFIETPHPLPTDGWIVATANIVGDDGVTSFTNRKGVDKTFTTTFNGLLKVFTDGGSYGKIHYVISAVPIPAAVLMFGSAIASMFGFSLFGKRKAATLLA